MNETVKLLIGGSPCTHWSIARKGREKTPEGMGWELFKNYLEAREKFRPTYFLYENNNSISAAIKSQITEELGVEPIMINSALVSAQSRKRLYWTNIPGVTQPEDRGILLRDILETVTDEKGYTLKVPGKPLTEREMEYMVRETTGGRNHFDFDYHHDATKEKGSCVTANTHRGVPYNVLVEPVRIGTIENKAKNEDFDSQQYRVYSPDAKSVTICGQGGGVGAKTGLYATPAPEGTDVGCPVYEVRGGLITIKGGKYPVKLADGFYIIRKLTVIECKRLQTVPDAFVFPVSDTQAYRMLGNGWTVEVIAHILSHCPGITGTPLEVLSMYDGMSCGRLALDKLGASVAAYWATEIDKYAIKTTQANFPDTVQLGDAFQVREDGWRPWEGVKT